MANGNGYLTLGRLLMSAVPSTIVIALAIVSGVWKIYAAGQAGVAQSEERQTTALEKSETRVSDRLDRIEAKVDRILERMPLGKR